MIPNNVTLIVKAPNQQIEDQNIECESSWTVRQLKGHLSEVYPSKPVSIMITMLLSVYYVAKQDNWDLIRLKFVSPRNYFKKFFRVDTSYKNEPVTKPLLVLWLIEMLGFKMNAFIYELLVFELEITNIRNIPSRNVWM